MTNQCIRWADRTQICDLLKSQIKSRYSNRIKIRSHVLNQIVCWPIKSTHVIQVRCKSDRYLYLPITLTTCESPEKLMWQIEGHKYKSIGTRANWEWRRASVAHAATLCDWFCSPSVWGLLMTSWWHHYYVTAMCDWHLICFIVIYAILLLTRTNYVRITNSCIYMAFYKFLYCFLYCTVYCSLIHTVSHYHAIYL